MTSGILHITFGMRGDGSLRAALRRAERGDHVVRLWDDLSVGPIDPPEPRARWQWAKRELGLFPHPQYLFVRKNNDWDVALSTSARRIAWVSRRRPHEYCGFLEWLSRIGDEPCDIVDLHNVDFDWPDRDGKIRRDKAPCMAGLFSKQIHDGALWDHARPLTSEERRSYQEIWRQLRTENAAFRVLGRERLVSAPIDYLDDRLLSQAGPRLLKVAGIVAKVSRQSLPYEVCDYVYHGRIHKLVQAGRLEAVGNLAYSGYSEVRLPDDVAAASSGSLET